MRRVFLGGHTNIRKRLLIHIGGSNLALLIRKLTGVGTPRALQGRLTAVLGALLPLICPLRRQQTPHWAVVRLFATLDRLNCSTRHRADRGERRGFHHGLLGAA